MGLWGTSESAESKPNWTKTGNAPEAYGEAVIATEAGWVYRHPGGYDELLVAVRGLSGAASAEAGLGNADITEIEFPSSIVTGSTLSVTVRFNERVLVTGTPQVTVTNGNESGNGLGNVTCNYASGSTTHELVFTSGSLAGGHSTDVFAIGANATGLNFGTIIDMRDDGTASGVASTITNSADSATNANGVTYTKPDAVTVTAP
jgi:hypothetical protein